MIAAITALAPEVKIALRFQVLESPGSAWMTWMVPQVIKLCCQGCGADLEVSEEVRFLTCNYCHSKLEVVRDVTATHTRVLEKLERTTDRIAGNLKVIELQNDLERLDREWELTRQSLLVRGRHGGLHEPSMAGSMFGGVVAIIGGIVFATFSGGHGSPGIFPVLGMLVSLIGLVQLVNGVSKASKLDEERSLYQDRREELTRQIEEERGT